eukprot:TRINITY_DN6332_c0_g1_i2.p1 TRINITY_DN6332_c0_g1~~TRINITY_DN6332_c0_g1_i2.p1  ORF type:complete len:467 (+),score=49.56 TRINITY_DN6332_c0_g1_i2:72-1472(+)
MRRLASVLVGCVLCLAGFSAERLQISGRWIKDELGRIRILRGYNIAADSKVPDFMPMKGKFNLLDQLQDLGVDIVRLLFIWEGYEPSPGRYDLTYLQYILELVQHLERLNIYVLVDLHQDGFSRWNLGGCGDGFPQFTVPAQLQSKPDNSPQNCSRWGLLLQDPEYQIVYQDFFKNQKNVKSKFLKVISDVGNKLKDQQNVIGFDLMNEPVADEVTELSPYYEEAAKILLNISSNFFIFFEPQQLVTSGLVESKLRKQNYTNAVFAPHFYNPFEFVGIYDYGVQTRVGFNRLQMKAKELDVPMFLGEFGCAINEYTKDYIRDYYNELDTLFVGGTQWTFTPTWNNVTFDGWNGENFSIVDNEGKLRAGYALRPSVRLVPGNPISFSFQQNVIKPVSFVWKQDSTLGNATMEMYLPLQQLGYTESQLQVATGLECKFGGHKGLYLKCVCVQDCDEQKFVEIYEFEKI